MYIVTFCLEYAYVVGYIYCAQTLNSTFSQYKTWNIDAIVIGSRCLSSIYVSESDILGPIAYLSDIEILVSFERAMFEEYSFKYRTKIFL